VTKKPRWGLYTVRPLIRKPKVYTTTGKKRNYKFPKDPGHLSDDEACKFIVALARARRSCSLVTNGQFDRSKKRLFHDPSEYLQLLPEKLKDSKKYRMVGGKLVEC
jgi:hypothetical protein